MLQTPKQVYAIILPKHPFQAHVGKSRASRESEPVAGSEPLPQELTASFGNAAAVATSFSSRRMIRAARFYVRVAWKSPKV